MNYFPQNNESKLNLNNLEHIKSFITFVLLGKLESDTRLDPSKPITHILKDIMLRPQGTFESINMSPRNNY